MTTPRFAPRTKLFAFTILLTLFLPTLGKAQTPIIYGETVKGTLAKGQIDTYIFAGTAGEIITGRMVSTWCCAPQFEIYGPTGALIKRMTATSNYTVRLDPLTLLATGTYTLLVMDNDGLDAGSYTLFLQRTANPVGSASLTYGQATSGSLPDQAGMASYTFAGTAGEIITARLVSSWCCAPQFEIYGPTGTLLTRMTATSNYTVRLDALTLLATGTYTLLVIDDDGRETGSYTLFLQRLVDPVGNATLTYGQTASVTLLKQAAMASYTFAGTAGEIITGRMVSTWCCAPQFEIYGPTGALIKRMTATSNYTVRLDPLTLLATGTYTLLVMDEDGREPASYSLFLQRTVNSVGSRQAYHGQTIQDTLKSKAEMKSFWFPAMNNEIITILMTSTWCCAPQFEIYGPTGALIKRMTATSNYTVRLDALTLLATGTYTLLVMDEDGLDKGGFTISLIRITRAWAGSLDSSWHNPANWYPSGIPTGGDSVVIGSALRRPVIYVPQAEVAVGSLDLRSTGSLKVAETVPRFSVSDYANVSGCLEIAPQDTFAIVSEYPGALRGAGAIPTGTIQRAIRQSGGATYRFESDNTTVGFSDSLASASSVSMTTYPDSLPPTSGTSWTDVPSRVHIPTHTVHADGVHLVTTDIPKADQAQRAVVSRRWAIRIPRGIRKPSALTDDETFIRRFYVVSMEGDRNAMASITLRYDPMEIPAGVPEDSLQICWSDGEPAGYVKREEPIPTDYALLKNYPNPFNPSTTIEYELPSAGTVSLRIFNVMGQLVKTLVEAPMSAGRYTERWDGSNEQGGTVAGGVYLCRLVATPQSGIRRVVQVQKMLYLK